MPRAGGVHYARRPLCNRKNSQPFRTVRKRGWPGHRRAEATPSFGRLRPAITKNEKMTIHLNTQADLDRAIHALVEQDPRLKPVLKRAGMPALRRRDPGYAGLAAIVCGQQLSTASAAAIWARVSAAFDPFHHDALRRARAERLGRLGLSAAKIKTLKNLARELAAERLNLEALANEEADAAHNTLTALHGIGPWTADVYLLFCLGHGD